MFKKTGRIILLFRHHPLILWPDPVTPLLRPLQFCNNKRKKQEEKLFSGKGNNNNNNNSNYVNNNNKKHENNFRVNGDKVISLEREKTISRTFISFSGASGYWLFLKVVDVPLIMTSLLYWHLNVWIRDFLYSTLIKLWLFSSHFWPLL